MIEKLESLGCDPIEGLASIATSPETTPELRVRCYSELAQYVYPKRKATDISSDDGQSPMRVVVEHIVAEPPTTA